MTRFAPRSVACERPDRGGPGRSADAPSTDKDAPAAPERTLPVLGNAMPDSADPADLPRLPQLYLTHPPRPVSEADWNALVGGSHQHQAGPREGQDAASQEEGQTGDFADGPEGRESHPSGGSGSTRGDAAGERRRPAVLRIAAAVTLVAALALAWRVWNGRHAGPTGSLTLTSRPAGATLLVDGQPRGKTPATFRLPAGPHVVEIHSDGPTRVLGFSLDKDAQISRYFELPAGTAPARLEVNTTPPQAVVTVDGRQRGRSPLVIEDLNPGVHRVRATLDSQSLERTVMMASAARGALNLIFDSADAPLPAGYGLLAVSIPIDVRAVESGTAVGTTQALPWQLKAGRHELDFFNDLLGVRVHESVDIADGLIQGLAIDIPPAVLSVTTAVGAEIFIDGEPRGTAVVKQAVTAGQHDVVARHPVLGERRLLVTVLPGASTDLEVDFSR